MVVVGNQSAVDRPITWLTLVYPQTLRWVHEFIPFGPLSPT